MHAIRLLRSKCGPVCSLADDWTAWSGRGSLGPACETGAQGARPQAPAQLNTCMYRDGTSPYRNLRRECTLQGAGINPISWKMENTMEPVLPSR